MTHSDTKLHPPLDVRSWRELAIEDPPAHLRALASLLARAAGGDPAWISLATFETLQGQMAGLRCRLEDSTDPDGELPLFGVPVAVKDNIDVLGLPTTAACPDFAYLPSTDAEVVARLRRVGALPVGKTNLDQFATGLVGTRTPYGAVPSAFDEGRIGGGSSSGSASVVSRGLVPLALGTDTAGSGRIPAGFQNVVGLKPTRGWLSCRGVVPACRTLDCVSVFALHPSDAWIAVSAMAGHDPTDPVSRPPHLGRIGLRSNPTFAVPDRLEFGDDAAKRAFESSLDRIEANGGRVEAIDFAPFAELASLLYQGPWVAERLVAAGPLLERNPDSVNGIVRRIVEEGGRFSALDAFLAQYRRGELANRIRVALAGYDALVVPTAPFHPTFLEVAANPVGVNSRLGTYTNFANLADLCALALPGEFREDALPAGITLLAPAWDDQALAAFGAAWCDAGQGAGLGRWKIAARPIRSPAAVEIAVVGAHLSGMPLNRQLVERGARLVRTCRTAPEYALHALAGTSPPKPGLVRGQGSGRIELEIWSMSPTAFAAFVAEVPPPLGIGNVRLEDGSWTKGFICEPAGLEGFVDITRFGGWRRYVAAISTTPPQELHA